ncbi:lysine 2,3-aminomutase [bacterium Unc6]|nr:lysine 2,3-aminomutase [bacterium Unc6]
MYTDYRRCELWKDVQEEQWEDWGWQIRNRITTVEQLKKVIDVTEEEEKGILQSKGRLAMAITPYWASLMDKEKPYCPIRRQAVPTVLESYVTAQETTDPLSEDEDSPVPGLVHRYPDRVLLLATDQCAMYCRHCTRRRLVGEGDFSISEHLEKAFEYIRANKKIRDVLISGGDPLMLPDERIETILKGIRSISSVEIVRIGSRVPVTLPMRITGNLISILKKYNLLWMSIHFNHPKEITKRCKRACSDVVDAGIPMGSQTVLLKGINERLYIMKKLMHDLLAIRVRPYYMYQCDLARGTSHFRAPVSVGIQLMEKLRGHTTGYAVPTYVIDAPGGGGKIPIAPNYIVSESNGVYTLRNYEGKIFRYSEETEFVSAAQEENTPAPLVEQKID